MILRLGLAIGGLLLVLYLWPSPQLVPYEARHYAMGTMVHLRLYGATEAESLVGQATAEIDRIAALMSRYEPESELSRINRTAGLGLQTCSPELRQVVERSLYWAGRSGGAFDISVGVLSRLWGFPEAMEPPAAASIEDVLPLVDYRQVLLESGGLELRSAGVSLDLGAAAKGYAVDRAVAVLQEAGAACGLLEAGGDFRFWGSKPDGHPWSFGIKHPRQRGRLVLADDIGLAAVATSGDYEQVFEYGGRRYHHLLDPATGYPAARAVSATVWAQTAMDADILSTAVFVMGAQRGLELVEALPQVEALVFFEEDGRLRHRASGGVAGHLHFD